MRNAITVVVGMILLAPSHLSAQERPAKSRIISAGLFKNGLAVIKRELQIPGPGTYRLDDLPEPVHGTWWVESTGAVETSVQQREVDAPGLVRANANLQDDLAG